MCHTFSQKIFFKEIGARNVENVLKYEPKFVSLKHFVPLQTLFPYCKIAIFCFIASLENSLYRENEILGARNPLCGIFHDKFLRNRRAQRGTFLRVLTPQDKNLWENQSKS